MKIKKLISSALVFVMLFTTLVAVIPVSSFAADETQKVSVADKKVEAETLKKIVNDYRHYGSVFDSEATGRKSVPAFTSARAALDYELDPDNNPETDDSYLDYFKSGNNVIYINRYTGLMFYENTLTGQILTSNPYDPAYQTKEGGAPVLGTYDRLSQIELRYFNAANTANIGDYNTLNWIEQNEKAPVISAIENGLSITYTIGVESDDFIAPSAMLYETALETILNPMFASLAEIMEQECGPFNSSYYVIFKGQALTSYNILDYIKTGKDLNLGDHFRISEITQFADAMDDYAYEYAKATKTKQSEKVAEFISQFKNFFNSYTFVDPEIYGENKKIADRVAAFGGDEPKVIMVMKGVVDENVELTTIRKVHKAISVTCKTFTKENAAEYEEQCGYNSSQELQIPQFVITLNYTIDTNGDLVVSMPANAISYKRDAWSITDISPIKYFGAGDMDRDGYVFFPDGSGAIVEFDDFYFGSTAGDRNNAVTPGDDIRMYGMDYSYAKVTGKHREQLVMPVYGLVNDTPSSNNGYSANYSTVTNGFFAVMEAGSALATLNYKSGGGEHKYISVFPSYSPFPTDSYDLSKSVSVSGLGEYKVASEAKYTGDIRTRYTMLVDHDIYAEAIIADASFVGYAADYVGMATCYRTYLENTGVISLIESDEILADLPLYIEALGSIDIIKKILSFPVTVSEPLTSFEDVEKMYSELSNAVKTLEEKAAAKDAEADAIESEKHSELRQGEIDSCRAAAKKFRELAARVDDIKNINFRLTGFANGGMHSTYPAKLKWEKSVGGNKGFSALVSNAATISSEADSHFGIYPDFDFMYINNTASFDGVGRRGVAACMVDNRYASKQAYDSVKQKFESLFALVVSSGAYDKLYNKFDKKYSTFGNNAISVSTLASDLNSDFDKKKALTREDSLNNVQALLAKMAEKQYSIMGDKGNFYTVKYLDHVLNAPIDSSHYNYTSYTVPFYGMVLHGYVNYAGTPINYSGSPEYEILRSIENGASLYYILCMDNTNYLKEDPLLSDYFGVDYNNWFEKIVAQYKVVNDAIGSLQNSRIVDHTKVLAERVIDEEEIISNYNKLIEEFEGVVNEEISENIDIAIKALRKAGNINVHVKFAVSDEDLNEIIAVFADRVNLTADVLCEEFGLDESLKAIFAAYAAQYSEGELVTLTAADVENYKTKYAYITDSSMFDEDYVRTDFTCDNGNVVMVTYESVVDGSTTVFILNYNVFSVKIKLDDALLEKFADDERLGADGYITLDKYDFIKG